MGLISLADQDGLIWFDGALVPWREAQVHVLTHGLHYASCVFEGARAYNGKVFRLNDHNERLRRSAEILDFELPFTVDEINAACEQALEANGLTDAYVRPVAWRGSETMGITATQTTIHVAIACWEWPSYFSPEARLKGIRLNLSKWRRPSPETAPVAAKAAGLYMICTLSKHAADAAGYDDSMMLDYRGKVAEATGAHVFFVQDGVLHTPTLHCVLDGITRRTVIEMAGRRGIEVVERDIELEELEGFEQAFVTGTAAEITPLSEVGPYNFEVGDLLKSLIEEYDALVRA